MGSVYLDDPAATEMYTYCHTLPLRDALPFSTPGSMQKLMPTRLARIASSESVSVSTANSSAARRRSIQASSCACPVTISSAPGADRAGSGAKSDRKGVVEGKRVSVRVNSGAWSVIKTHTDTANSAIEKH